MLKEYVATHIQYNMQLYDIKNAFQNYWVLWYHIFIQKKNRIKLFFSMDTRVIWRSNFIAWKMNLKLLL